MNARFANFVVPEPMSGCWIWTGALTPQGYGTFFKNMAARTVMAHRFAYEEARGAIPAGRHIDHLCRNRCCVNPDHLEAVTNKVNVLRGHGSPAENARKFECKRGHPFTHESTRINKDGSRQCRRCVVIRQRERRQAKALAQKIEKARADLRAKTEPSE